MLITVTLNPALDRALTVPGFVPGEVNRVTRTQTDPGGKGVNVSRALLALGCGSRVMGIAAGAAGDALEASLRAQGLETDFLRVPGETRTNVKLTDSETGVTTELNEPGPGVTPEILEAFAARLRETVHGGDTVLFSGSLPVGAPADTYASLIRLCRNRGVKTVLDTSGEALAAALDAKPYLLKPNLRELAQAVGRELETVQQVIPAARELSMRTGGAVAVTMGADGAVYLKDGMAWYAAAPKVEAVSAVGAGDAFLAGLAAAEVSGLETRDALSLAVAAGSAAACTAGTDAPAIEDVLYLAELVKSAPVLG